MICCAISRGMTVRNRMAPATCTAKHPVNISYASRFTAGHYDDIMEINEYYRIQGV